MTTLRESRAGSPVTQAIVGLKNLILDPDEVPSGTIATIPQYSDKAEGDVITLKWLGVAGATYTFSVTVDASNSSARIPIAIAYTPYIIGNLDTNVSVIYEVRRKNGRTATSSALVFRIERQLGQNLVAPTVIQAVGGTLDPINTRSGATVRVAYVGMLATDILAVDWRGEDVADSHQTEQKNGSLFGYVDFDIPVSVVAASQGKTIRVFYAVIRGANPGVLSQPLDLPVSVLGQQHLPAPAVPQASGGTLDLSRFAGDASATVEAWPLIVRGQRYWITATGTLENGSAYSFYVVRGALIDDEQVRDGVLAALLRRELEQLRNDSEITITIQVAFDGVNNQDSAVVFPVRTYTVKTFEIVVPTIDSIVDAQGVEIPHGGSTRATTLTLRGSASINQQVEIFDGQASAGNASVNASGIWTRQLSGLSVAQHRFTARGLYGGQPVSVEHLVNVLPLIQCVDFNAIPVGTRYPDQQTTTIANLVSFSPSVLTSSGQASRFPINAQIIAYSSSRAIQLALHSHDGSVPGGPYAHRVSITASDRTQKLKVTFYVTSVRVYVNGAWRGVGVRHIVEVAPGQEVYFLMATNGGYISGTAVITDICVGG